MIEIPPGTAAAVVSGNTIQPTHKPKAKKRRKPKRRKPLPASLVPKRDGSEQVEFDTEKAKPKLPPLDPNVSLREAYNLATEGSIKLSRGIDILRRHLQTIVQAEVDNTTGLPVSAKQLRMLAAEALAEFANHAGQPASKRVIDSRAGDRSQSTFEEDGYE